MRKKIGHMNKLQERCRSKKSEVRVIITQTAKSVGVGLGRETGKTEKESNNKTESQKERALFGYEGNSCL